MVKHPLKLSLAELGRMAQVDIKHNGVGSDGSFNGVFWLRGCRCAACCGGPG